MEFRSQPSIKSLPVSPNAGSEGQMFRKTEGLGPQSPLVSESPPAGFGHSHELRVHGSICTPSSYADPAAEKNPRFRGGMRVLRLRGVGDPSCSRWTSISKSQGSDEVQPGAFGIPRAGLPGITTGCNRPPASRAAADPAVRYADIRLTANPDYSTQLRGAA